MPPPTRRVSPEQVCVIFRTTEKPTVIAELIDIGSAMVDEAATQDSKCTAQQLERAELYLSAHLIQMRGGGGGSPVSVKVGPITERFERGKATDDFLTIAIQACPKIHELFFADDSVALEFSVLGRDDGIIAPVIK